MCDTGIGNGTYATLHSILGSQIYLSYGWRQLCFQQGHRKCVCWLGVTGIGSEWAPSHEWNEWLHPSLPPGVWWGQGCLHSKQSGLNPLMYLSDYTLGKIQSDILHLTLDMVSSNWSDQHNVLNSRSRVRSPTPPETLQLQLRFSLTFHLCFWPGIRSLSSSLHDLIAVSIFVASRNSHQLANSKDCRNRPTNHGQVCYRLLR